MSFEVDPSWRVRLRGMKKLGVTSSSRQRINSVKHTSVARASHRSDRVEVKPNSKETITLSLSTCNADSSATIKKILKMNLLHNSEIVCRLKTNEYIKRLLSTF